MKLLLVILCGFLIICAICVCLIKNLTIAVIVQMTYSLIMSIIWCILESPDLAITEAAVGAGVTTVLFFVAMKRIHVLEADDHEQEES